MAKTGKIRVPSMGSSPAEGTEGLEDSLLGGQNGQVARLALNG